MLGLGVAAGAGLGSKILTGLNIAGGLSLIPMGMGLTDSMYESAVKTGPQGLDDEYKIGPLRGALGLIDPRFTQEGLAAGRNKYVMNEITSTPGFYQRDRYGIRGPKSGESQSDYLLSTGGALQDAIKKEKKDNYKSELEWAREFARNDPDSIAARENAKTKNELLRQQLGIQANELAAKRIDSNNQFNYLIAKEGRLEKQDFEARQEKARLDNRLASNQLQVSMAQLGLQKQDQANQMSMYSQQLADAKETRNLALIGATVDGLGMTLNGLFNRRA